MQNHNDRIKIVETEKKPDSAGHAINAVSKINRIRDADKPENRQRKAQNSQRELSDKRVWR